MRSRETTIEHERAEQELRYLATLVAFSEDAVIGKTLDGTIEYWNKAAERMYGYTAEEVIGKSVSIIVPPDRLEEFSGFLNKIQHGERISQIETVRVRKDGTRIDVSLSIAPILDRAGHPIYASTITRDITAHRRAQQALLESRHRMQAILETTVEGIITIDEKGHIESFNPAAERIFGYAAREVIGRNVNMLMPSPHHEEHETHLRRYRETGKKKIIGMGREVIGMRKDGTTFPMELEVSEVRLGRQRLFTGFVRDITVRRRLERKILDISEQERQRIGQDLHDGLGSLLTGVAMRAQALAQLLAKGEIIRAVDLEQIAEWVEEGATHAQALARGLNPVMLETQGLRAALQEVAITVQTLSGIPCTFEGDESLPPVHGTVAVQLYRIAQEAAHNAARHARPQRIQIRIAAEAGNLLLTVRDDGIGYPEDVSSGAGMGHHIMPYRAQLIDAVFSISRMPGGGTLVSCSLPLEQATLPSLSTKDST